MSVYAEPIRTNNLAEGFNRTLIERMGGAHRNIWVWIDRLIEIMADQEIKYLRVTEGVPISNETRRLRWIEDDQRIINAQRNLDSRRWSMDDFLLNALTPRHRHILEAETLDIPNDQDNLELPDVADIRVPENALPDLEPVENDIRHPRGQPQGYRHRRRRRNAAVVPPLNELLQEVNNEDDGGGRNQNIRQPQIQRANVPLNDLLQIDNDNGRVNEDHNQKQPQYQRRGRQGRAHGRQRGAVRIAPYVRNNAVNVVEAENIGRQEIVQPLPEEIPVMEMEEIPDIENIIFN
ncbi:uncharacterized protein LOC123261414 [Cotesia glomerata]|uniref:Uncharacterized protein n=1 Tax=Cotesia glomerata TaxID=32391 RepID=A0AAV7IHD6_COTGL|nr:uncharacterized protein LOC123261414 [Cotesia glomerata]KAH0549819.1 hypothetical protein KQX54_014536 [Cotesia glomerata]